MNEGIFKEEKMPSRDSSTNVQSETDKPGKKMKSNKKEKINAEKVHVYVADIQEPTSRAELIKYWMNVTLDKNTANKMLWISDNGSKVSRRKEEVCPVLDRPERYEYSPQVVSKEGVWNMRAYWEVEYSGWVVIGATYEGAGRRSGSGPSGLGENQESWGLCCSATGYEFWHDGRNRDVGDAAPCSTIGVYVDQPAGIISFYGVEGEGAAREVRLLTRIKTAIEKKILPGFWVGIQSSCTILDRAE